MPRLSPGARRRTARPVPRLDRARRPGGEDHLEETLAPGAGSGYTGLQSPRAARTTSCAAAAPPRRGASAPASGARCCHFVQLTDPQIADEMSPARVDFADPAGGEIKSSWRPQEALGLQVFDSVVRNVNANRASRVRQGNGKRAQDGVRDHHRRPRRQPAAQRDALVQDRARRRAASTRSPASRSRPSAATSPRTRSRASTPTSPPATTPASPTTTTTATRRPTASPASTTRTRPRRPPARTRPSRATPACSRPPSARSRPPAWTCPGTSRAATTTA